MNQTPPNEHQAQDAPQTPPPQQPNPYQASWQDTTPPDLDAGAPYLKTTDVQRLNRKALWFLAGIVLMVGVLLFWVFSGAFSRNDNVARSPAPVEQVIIPAAPNLPELPPERPVAMEELPPLPVIDDAPPAQGGDSGFGLSGFDERLRSLLDRRMADASGAGVVDGEGEETPGMLGGMPGEGGGAFGQGPATGPTSAKPLYKPDTLMLRGTYIRCVLESRVITDVPGYTSCVVTEPVYSVNGRRLLLPRGSKVFGFYNSDALVGERAAIVWDRITTPGGLDVNMRSPGVDMLGSAGNTGHYTEHWAHRITSALLISMLSDAFKYAGAKHGPRQTTYTNGMVVDSPYESNTARTTERLANMVLERNMARPPTVTINQGTIVNVYVARDVDFSAVLR